MAKTKIVKKFDDKAASISDVYLDYAVKTQIKAADVPPRKPLDISFSNASKIGDSKQATNQEAYEESHGKLYDMTHKNTVPWRNWVVYVVLISLLTCCFTFSKYMSGSSGTGAVTVAKFNVVTSAAIDEEDFDISPAGDTAVSSFTFGEEQEKTFSIKVTSTSDVPVRVTVSKADGSLAANPVGNNFIDIPACEDDNAKEGVVTFSVPIPSLPANTTGTGTYDAGNLIFDVIIDQLD